MSLLDQIVSSQTRSLWHQRTFLLLWIASSPGSLARFVVRLALPLVAIRLTTSTLLVSGVTFARAVPWLLFGLPSPLLADRFDRRHVLLWAAALGLGVCVLLAGVALLLGISETVTETAPTAFTPLLLSHSQLEQATMRLLGVPKETLLLVLHLLAETARKKGCFMVTQALAVLLLGQMAIGLGFGLIDPSLYTMATLTFQERLASALNMLHGLFGLGSLLGPLVLAFGLHVFQSLELAYFVGVGVAAITILLLLVQQLPQLARQATNVQHKRAANSERQNVLRPGFLWLMVLQVSICAAAEIGFGNWIVTAASQSAEISLAQAAPVATAFFLGLTAGRLGGAQVLRRGWMSEASLLYVVLCGGVVCGTLVAMFASQVLVAYVASALVGCFYGPLEPSIMAITSRRFVHAIGPVSSLLIISTNVTSMVVPAAMGLLIPALGINWVIAIPSLCCAFAVLPMQLSNRAYPEAQTDHHDG